jgi:hypothetical protein
VDVHRILEQDRQLDEARVGGEARVEVRKIALDLRP